MTHPPLLVPDLIALHTIVDATIHNSKVRFAIVPGGVVYEGTARSIGEQNGNFDYNKDVRDLYLRVTMDSGFERFIPVQQVVQWVHNGGFAVD